jgi:hypothetical protein
MTMSTKVQMPYLVTTMSIFRQEKLNVVEGIACNCSHPTWKPTSCGSKGVVNYIMGSIAFVAMCTTYEVDTHKVDGMCGMHTIEGWDSPSCVRSVVEKTREDNWKARKIGWVINQAFAPWPKHDKIRARWALNISLENMLKRVWWCKRFEKEFWNWTICCSMSCSNRRRHTRARGGRRSHVALKCCWKGNVLSIHAKVSKRKRCWSTINLASMIEMTRAQLFK